MNTAQDTRAARFEVEDAVIRLFVATDRREWPAVEASFTDPFTLDMTSMAGGTPTTMTPRQVANAWADGFLTLDHVIAASVKSRLFVGDYEIDLALQVDRWRSGRLKFNLKFIEGNIELEKAT